MQYYALCMQEESVKLGKFMTMHGLSQQSLATAAKVSQSTVSRALQGACQRHGNARHKLCIYAGLREPIPRYTGKSGIKRVVEAFTGIWDGSDAHASAVARVIEALAGLKASPRVAPGERRGKRSKATKEATKKRRAK